MVKVDIISGFLGAGKTTLIKKLFESSLNKDKVVIIENEFGEIGIDGTFLKESGVKIREINSGCICCSLVGDFSKSMKEIIDNYSPDRIIIEPSGVGKLSDIIRAIEKVEEEMSINIVCCVVDAKKVKLQINNFGEFLQDQIKYARSIVLSKVDMVDEHKLQEDLELIKSYNPNANVISTNISTLDANQLLKVLESEDSLKNEMLLELEREHEEDDDDEDEHECCHHHYHDEDEHDHECCHHHHHDEDEDHDHHCCHHHDDEDEDEDHDEHEHDHEHGCCHHHHHHDHDADEVFTSWGMETAKSISKEGLIQFLDYLKNETNGIILRSKGILKDKNSNDWFYFDFVDGDYDIRLGNPDYTGRIVVIGSRIDTHEIEEKFNIKADI